MLNFIFKGSESKCTEYIIRQFYNYADNTRRQWQFDWKRLLHPKGKKITIWSLCADVPITRRSTYDFFQRNVKFGFLLLSKTWVVTLSLRALGYVAKIFTKSNCTKSLVCFSDEARLKWDEINSEVAFLFLSTTIFTRYNFFHIHTYYDSITIEDIS